MKNKLGCFLLLMSVGFLACKDGYQQEEGEWVFVTIDEGFGKRSHPLEVDDESFEVLKYKSYARDKDQVLYLRDPIMDADPGSFEVINKNGYAKDQNHVYFHGMEVLLANPATFETLRLPYAKDDQRIFCGTLPMMVGNIDEFRVTRSTIARTGVLKSAFIEENAAYSFLDTFDVEVIYYGRGRGETKSEKFVDFKKVDAAGE